MEQEVPITVTVATNLGFTISDALAVGVGFGEVDPGSTNNNASENYAGANNGTKYNLSITSTTNVDVDVATKATDLTNQTYAIGVGNVSWASNATTDATWPSLDYEKAFQLNYDNTTLVGDNLVADESRHLRFWLDIPATQRALTYSGFMYIKAVRDGATF
jgi:hypothetical protein